jgi:DNA-nicking Smr family endonuclease
MARRLAPEEKALWEKVIATVRPLEPRVAEPETEIAAPPEAAPAPAKAPPAPRPQPTARRPKVQPANTLDGTWDRRLSRGLLQPDITVDLHGHDLGGAYALLDSRLEQAIAMGARLLLLITGKPPTGNDRPVRRGAIRAAVGDWLAASRHASGIAAVRAAHPRHGGAGALYIILRRRK